MDNNLMPDLEFTDDTLDNVFSVQTSQPQIKVADAKTEEPNKGEKSDSQSAGTDASTGGADQEQHKRQEEAEAASADKGGQAQEPDPNIVAAYNYYRSIDFIDNPDEEDYEFPGTQDSLEELLTKSQDQKVAATMDSIVDPLQDFAKAMINLAITKGRDMKAEDFESVFNEIRPSTMQATDFDDEDKAAAFMRNIYIEQGNDAEDADDLVQVLRDKDKLQSHAKTQFEKIETAKSEKAKELSDQAKGQRLDPVRSKREFAENFASAVDEMGWRQDHATKVVDEFFQGKFKAKMNKAMSDPKAKALAQLVEFASYLDEKTGVIDVESYKKEAFSGANKKVANDMQHNFWASSRKSAQANKATTASGEEQQYEFVD